VAITINHFRGVMHFAAHSHGRAAIFVCARPLWTPDLPISPSCSMVQGPRGPTRQVNSQHGHAATRPQAFGHQPDAPGSRFSTCMKMEIFGWGLVGLTFQHIIDFRLPSCPQLCFPHVSLLHFFFLAALSRKSTYLATIASNPHCR